MVILNMVHHHHQSVYSCVLVTKVRGAYFVIDSGNVDKNILILDCHSFPPTLQVRCLTPTSAGPATPTAGQTRPRPCRRTTTPRCWWWTVVEPSSCSVAPSDREPATNISSRTSAPSPRPCSSLWQPTLRQDQHSASLVSQRRGFVERFIVLFSRSSALQSLEPKH